MTTSRYGSWVVQDSPRDGTVLNAGTFKLPPTQVEAMYDPNTYAYSVNEVMVVK